MATYFKGCLALHHKMKTLTAEYTTIGSRNRARIVMELVRNHKGAHTSTCPNPKNGEFAGLG